MIVKSLKTFDVYHKCTTEVTHIFGCDSFSVKFPTLTVYQNVSPIIFSYIFIHIRLHY